MVWHHNVVRTKKVVHKPPRRVSHHKYHTNYITNSSVASIDNWRGECSYIVFCLTNFFWNPLFLWSWNTNIWIFTPPIIDAGCITDYKFNPCTTLTRFSWYVSVLIGQGFHFEWKFSSIRPLFKLYDLWKYYDD